MTSSSHSNRRLTNRQNAVLAAVERRRSCTVSNLCGDFPQLKPSAIEQVLDSLERRGLLTRHGTDLVHAGSATSVHRAPQAWLHTIEDDLADLRAGEPFPLWTLAPLDRSTGKVRRRKNGGPYEPAWGAGDEVVVYHAPSRRCVALVVATGGPRFRCSDSSFDLDTIAAAYDPAGPAPSVLATKPRQGGRRRISRGQLAVARRCFGLDT
jgi:hypothetical protein